MPKRRMTLDEVERLQAKAVQFLQDVVDDPDKAEEFESMTPEEYAEHKGVEIIEGNPFPATNCSRRAIMTKEQLEERIAELEEDNQELQDRLDSIIDIAQPEEEEGDGDETNDEGEDAD